MGFPAGVSSPAYAGAPQTKKESFFGGHVPLKDSQFVKTTSEELAAIKAKLLGRKPGQHTRPAFWSLGIIAMVLLLTGQYVYFHRNTLARHEILGAYITQACELIQCAIIPQQDVGLIELMDTKVSPHPGYERALQVKATLINRAHFAQPYPLLEITLTDRRGETNGRRTYSPKEYLENVEPLENANLMPQNVAVKVSLDIANPGDETEGYEIRLVSN